MQIHCLDAKVNESAENASLSSPGFNCSFFYETRNETKKKRRAKIWGEFGYRNMEAVVKYKTTSFEC